MEKTKLTDVDVYLLQGILSCSAPLPKSSNKLLQKKFILISLQIIKKQG